MLGHFLTLCMKELSSFITQQASILFEVRNRNSRTRCEICSQLRIKTPEQRHWHHSGVFIVSVEHISYHVLVFLLLTLDMQIRLSGLFFLYAKLRATKIYWNKAADQLLLPHTKFFSKKRKEIWN